MVQGISSRELAQFDLLAKNGLLRKPRPAPNIEIIYEQNVYMQQLVSYWLAIEKFFNLSWVYTNIYTNISFRDIRICDLLLGTRNFTIPDLHKFGDH